MNTKSILAMTGALLLSIGAGSALANGSDGGIANEKAESDAWILTGAELAAYKMESEPTAAGMEESTVDQSAYESTSTQPQTAVQYKYDQFGSND